METIDEIVRGSPALTFQSDSYPMWWDSRVPKRVRMNLTVYSEIPAIVLESSGSKRLIAACAGEENDIG